MQLLAIRAIDRFRHRKQEGRRVLSEEFYKPFKRNLLNETYGFWNWAFSVRGMNNVSLSWRSSGKFSTNWKFGCLGLQLSAWLRSRFNGIYFNACVCRVFTCVRSLSTDSGGFLNTDYEVSHRNMLLTLLKPLSLLQVLGTYQFILTTWRMHVINYRGFATRFSRSRDATDYRRVSEARCKRCVCSQGDRYIIVHNYHLSWHSRQLSRHGKLFLSPIEKRSLITWRCVALRNGATSCSLQDDPGDPNGNVLLSVSNRDRLKKSSHIRSAPKDTSGHPTQGTRNQNGTRMLCCL